MPHGPKGVSKEELREKGEHEAEELDLSLPFKKRLVAEVKNYADEYGIASLADVVTEMNTRGKDLEFQGELAVYATRNEARIKAGLEQLVKEGKLQHVKRPGHKVGYALPAPSRTRTRTIFMTRTTRRGKKVRHPRTTAIIDFTPDEIGKGS